MAAFAGAGVAVFGFAFDTLFEIFHELFFPAGSYSFDPATDKLVQLFPFAFWDETAIVAGALIVVIAATVAVFAGRRERRPTAAGAAEPTTPIVATR